MRYLPRQAEAARLTTPELREAFLIEGLFVPGALRIVLTDADRLVVAGAMPTTEVPLPPVAQFGTEFFTERREVGILNLGAPGLVRVGVREFVLDRFDGLYIGAGEPDVVLAPAGAEPPSLYLLSCPAHCTYPSAHIRREHAVSMQLGEAGRASCRRILRYIHAGGTPSCQLVMGLTELSNGSVWNTMPPHTHSRRSEVYLYFGLPADAVVFHILGEPDQTRHVVVRDGQAVISPPWSIHAGAGTAPYKFVWGMAGENQRFEDTDAAPLHLLR